MLVDSYNCSVQLINEEDFRPVGHFRRRSIVVIRHTPVIIGEPAAALGTECESHWSWSGGNDSCVVEGRSAHCECIDLNPPPPFPPQPTLYTIIGNYMNIKSWHITKRRGIIIFKVLLHLNRFLQIEINLCMTQTFFYFLPDFRVIFNIKHPMSNVV